MGGVHLWAWTEYNLTGVLVACALIFSLDNFLLGQNG